MTLLAGVLHEIPDDIASALNSENALADLWNGLTPIQRNEWICWITIVKKPETRLAHIERMVVDLPAGKRSPCCWPGCPHRRVSAKKYFKSSSVD